ncbi:MAG: DUF2867 domain-containing protein [Mycobacteriaceae bacterium]|nr:DUF2867 domain-containing protein [Mycobacteriaceae bacterium]
MRLPDEAHFGRPWRIHEFTRDFRLEDVWALPTPGGPHDFPRLIELAGSFQGSGQRFSVVGFLFAVRIALGRILGWDREIDDPDRESVRQRLPADLRARPSSIQPAMGFTALYQLDDEWAAELINRTVHGVLHLGWVPEGDGYRGQLAIMVKPNGFLGRAYLAAITPFRYGVVYPRMLRDIGRQWYSHKGSRS